MIFDSRFFGVQGVTDEDRQYAGSTYAEVRDAIFANSYYQTWGGPEEPPLPVYGVTLGRTLSGVWSRMRWKFQQAANRTVETRDDLRWGPDGRGFRRLLHPTAVCLTGTWEIDANAAGTRYTGYFKGGSRALVIARYSSSTQTRSGHYRSLAMVGKLYPTTDPNDASPVRPAHFITQEDFGGSKRDVRDAELRNAPDTSPWRKGKDLPVLMLTGFVLMRADKMPTFRQLYEIAELGKPPTEATRAPEFMRLLPDADNSPAPQDDADYRDEILNYMYDRGNPAPRRKLIFHVEVSDNGKTWGQLVQRRTIEDWKRIGRLVFSEGVASYNGDFVLHFHHPVWRNDRNEPTTVARARLRGV